MSKWVKRVLSVMLVCVLVGGALPLGSVVAGASADAAIVLEEFIPIKTNRVGFVQTQAPSLQSVDVDPVGHYWLSDDCYPGVALGRSVPDILNVGTTYYFNYETLQRQDWYDWSHPETLVHIDSISNLQYTVTLSIYNPAGSLLVRQNYTNDQNWISIQPSNTGLYKFTVVVTGDLEFSKTWEVEVFPSGYVHNPQPTIIQNKPIEFWSDEKNAIASVNIDFSDYLFNNSATIYNHNLALASMTLSAAAYDWYYVARALSNELGFKNVEQRNYNAQPDDVGSDLVAYTFGVKQVVCNGQRFNLIAVVVRGTVGSEWYSNFNIGSSQKHAGFNIAAERVYAALNNYVININNNLPNKILVTGHSRGAAVANIVGKELTRMQTIAVKNNIYTYTFATPNVSQESDAKDANKYNNIFNFVNPEDFVPYLPLSVAGWDYWKFGKTIAFPSYNTLVFPGQTTSKEKMNVKFREITGKNYSAYKKGLDPVQLLVNDMKNLAGTPSKFYELPKSGYVISPYDFMMQIGRYKAGAINKAEVGAFLANYSLDRYYGALSRFFIWYADDTGVAHCPEAYLAWILSTDSSIQNTTNIRGKYARVACPVDIEVYDSSNNLVGRVVNDEIDESIEDGLALSVDGDIKNIYLPVEGDYTIKIVGTDAGTMDYTVSEVDAVTCEVIGEKEWTDIALATSKTMTSNVSGDIFAEDVQLFVDAGTNSPPKAILTDGTETEAPFFPREKTGDDGVTNWDFIVPVTHKKTVPSGYTSIRTAQELSNIRNNLGGKYILMNDIDLASWGNWIPIEANFTGMLDGNGYAVKSLTINRTLSTNSGQGLFSILGRCKIVNLCLVDVDIDVTHNATDDSGLNVGSLAASAGASEFSNCFSTGNIGVVVNGARATANVGGLFGNGGYASYTSCFNEASVLSQTERGSYAGGIVGAFYSSGAQLNACYNAGNIEIISTASSSSTTSSAGGIFGFDDKNTIANECYNIGDITISQSPSGRAGGIAGRIYSGLGLNKCYNAGKIFVSSVWSSGTATAYAGGLVGLSGARITDCYNTGEVYTESTESRAASGGIVGLGSSSTITNSYNAGNIMVANESDFVGGIVGNSSSSLSGAYFHDISTSAAGNGSTTGATMLSAVQMKNKASYSAFDFNTVWKIDAGVNNGYPYLQGIPVTSWAEPVKKYIVKYDANGGAGAPESQNKVATETLVLSNIQPTCTGYTFKGWATSAGGVAQYQPGGNYTADAAVTLYAVWQANTYTVRYNANGGSGTMTDATHTYDAAKALDANAFTKADRFFGGWATTESSMEVYADRQSVSNLTAINGAVVILYAVWKSADTTALTARITALQSITQGNYTNDSWAAFQSALSNAQSVVSNPSSTQAQIDNALNALNMAYAGLRSLYTVTVNSGTGNGSFSANATVNITANTAPSGKVFDKWTTSDGVTFANANASSTSFTMPAKNVTVTATYKDAPGIFGTNPKWYGAWWHYLLFFFCFGFIWMWF